MGSQHAGMNHFHLLLPGLLGRTRWTGEQAEETVHAPALERLLSRADLQLVPASTIAQVCACFDLVEEEMALPVAALTRPIDTGKRSDGYWLRLDPVHLQAGAREILMTNPDDLQLGQEHNQVLGALCAAHLSELGLTLDFTAVGRWYLQLPDPPELFTRSPQDCIDQDIAADLPRGSAGPLWHRYMTELQMVLAGHAVNSDREQLGLPAVNSVWPWGGGVLPETVPARGTAYGDDLLLSGLARWADWSYRPLPYGFESMMEGPKAGRAAMLFGPDVLPEPEADPSARKEAIGQLERNWFAPIERALKRRQIHTLWLYPGRGLRLRSGMRQAWRLWRRPKSLQRWRAAP